MSGKRGVHHLDVQNRHERADQRAANAAEATATFVRADGIFLPPRRS
jgi:hypothetical protein